MVPLDAEMSGVCNWVNSMHCAKWHTAWSNCKMRSFREQGLWT